MLCCIRCGKELSDVDIGAYKKFINRCSTEFMCKSCLAKELKVSEELIDKKIEYFKKQGCTLFQSVD